MILGAKATAEVPRIFGKANMHIHGSIIGACGVALFVIGCATTPESAPETDYGPRTTTYSKKNLIEKSEITMPPNFSTSDFTHLVMAINFKASDKLPQNVGAGEEPLQIDPSLSLRFQNEIAKLKRFQVVALHGVDTETDVAAAADLSNGNLEAAEQEKPLKYNVLLQGQLIGTKSRTVIRGTGTDPDRAQIVYKVYVIATCKDLRKGTVGHSVDAVGKARPRMQTLVNGRARGGFDAKDESQAVWEATQNALIEIGNKIGNSFPAGGHVIGVSRSGDNMTLDKGLEDGIGVGQQCVIAIDDGGVTLPIAMAEAFPENGQHKSALKIYRWNDTDNDAKAIVTELKAGPRQFFKENKDSLFAVCYGVAVPPEWEQNATK